MNKLTIEQANYIAGWVDGDGSIIAQLVSRHDYVLKYQIRISVLFVQKKSRYHELLRFQSEIGAGVLRDRGDGIAELSIVGKNEVGQFLKQIQPYLRNKQKQANLVLRICEQLEGVKNDPQKFLELCEIADRISSLNDSKNRTVTTEVVKQSFIDSGLISEE
jgi:hypothetical protein